MPPKNPKTKYPCAACNKNISENCDSIECDTCSKWIHKKCNKLSNADFKRLQEEGDSAPFSCIVCINDAIPFSSISNTEFHQIATKGNLPDQTNNAGNQNYPISPLIESHIKQLNTYLNQNITQQNDADLDDNDNLSPINCNYFDYDEFNKASFNSNKSFSIFHLNIHSITHHIDELKELLSVLESGNFEFDILAITESKLNSDLAPTVNITIPNYHPPVSTPSDAEKGGVLLYVNKRIPDFKVRSDLNAILYESKLLESVFIEIKHPKKSNDIIGVVYRHPSMELGIFNENFLCPFTDKLFLEKNKNIYIAGDFNVNLLNVSHHTESSNFFNLLCSNHLLPTISHQTQ